MNSTSNSPDINTRNKVIKIINSCENREQLKIASKVYRHFYYQVLFRYKNDSIKLVLIQAVTSAYIRKSLELIGDGFYDAY